MALRLPKQDYRDIERIIELDFVRATEAAALNSLPWLGRGEKEKADAAACDALRGMFDLMNICGEVVIGEGIKDDAPGIFKGEQLGTWVPGAPQVPSCSPLKIPGASSLIPSPITTSPQMFIRSNMPRSASHAAASAFSFSPRPSQGKEFSAAASVARTKSNSMIRSMSW